MTAAPGVCVCSTPQSLYTAGDLVPVTGSFFQVDEATPVTPTTVTLKWSPSGTTTVTTVVCTPGSVVTTNIDTTGLNPVTSEPEPVEVIYEYIGTGACQASGQGFFQVAPLPF
jgi:hypothetical protein